RHFFGAANPNVGGLHVFVEGFILLFVGLLLPRLGILFARVHGFPEVVTFILILGMFGARLGGRGLQFGTLAFVLGRLLAEFGGFAFGVRGPAGVVVAVLFAFGVFRVPLVV